MNETLKKLLAEQNQNKNALHVAAAAIKKLQDEQSMLLLEAKHLEEKINLAKSLVGPNTTVGDPYAFPPDQR